MTDSNGWDEYKKLVLRELESSNSRLNNNNSRLRTIEERLTIINTKIYVAAFISSAVITGVVQYVFGLN